MTELNPARAAFINDLAAKGGKVARANDLPVGAMLACASVESAWGTSKIYKSTGNPFNLQKWPHTPYPHTNKTFWQDTGVIVGPPEVLRKAPFNCATDLGDAVLQWCEWILHWGQADGPGAIQMAKGAKDNPAAIANRDLLLTYRKNSADFSKNLPLVGFGENATPALRQRSGAVYRQRLIDFALNTYD